MRQLSFLAGRRIWRLVPLAASGLLLAGCDSSSSKTAAFPDVPKVSTKAEAPTKPAKGMDRAGSDSVKPM